MNDIWGLKQAVLSYFFGLPKLTSIDIGAFSSLSFSFHFCKIHDFDFMLKLEVQHGDSLWTGKSVPLSYSCWCFRLNSDTCYYQEEGDATVDPNLILEKVDFDLGNYERLLDFKLTRDNNITTGNIYQNVIEKERKGGYLGEIVQPAMKEWTLNTEIFNNLHEPVKTAMIGKYIGLSNAYHSFVKRKKLVVDWVAAQDLEDSMRTEIADAILVPGGFEDMGVEGKILDATYARKSVKQCPYLDICLGLQINVIEYARSVLRVKM